MLSKIPLPDKPKDLKQILRIGIIAELDAVSLYEQLADRQDIKKLCWTLQRKKRNRSKS